MLRNLFISFVVTLQVAASGREHASLLQLLREELEQPKDELAQPPVPLLLSQDVLKREDVKLTPEKYQACADTVVEKLPGNWGHFLDEPPDHSTAWVGVELLASMDHIYMLCMDCSNVAIPSRWADKMSLVDGHVSDECFSAVADIHLWKVTMAHKMIVHHAKMQGHSKIAIIEEDAVIMDQDFWTEKAASHLLAYVKAEPWQVVRLNILPLCNAGCMESPEKIGQAWGRDTACEQRCACQTLPILLEGRVMCTVNAGCKENHGAGAYLLSAGAFDTFLAATGGIDMDLLAKLNQVNIMPAIYTQPAMSTIERDRQQTYMQCAQD